MSRLLRTIVPSLAGGYQPENDAEKEFADIHVADLDNENEGNGDDVYKASKIKTYDRKKDRRGYNPGEDEEEYKKHNSSKRGFCNDDDDDDEHQQVASESAVLAYNNWERENLNALPRSTDRTNWREKFQVARKLRKRAEREDAKSAASFDYSSLRNVKEDEEVNEVYYLNIPEHRHKKFKTYDEISSYAAQQHIDSIRLKKYLQVEAWNNNNQKSNNQSSSISDDDHSDPLKNKKPKKETGMVKTKYKDEAANG